MLPLARQPVRPGHLDSRRPATIWAVLAVAAVAWLPVACTAADSDAQSIAIVPAGTPVDDPDRDRWNRVVLLATPRFASGDTDAVSEGIHAHVTSFTFAVLATVRSVETDDDGPRHRLVEVGVGYGTPIGDRLTIVSPNAKLPGFTPDFLGRQILGAKQKSLDEIVQVGAHATAVAFDAPTLMLRDDEHRDMIVRHVVRVDPRTGGCSSCVWLAQENDDGTLTPAGDPLRLVAGGTHESRAVHVDGNRFVFGFPTKQAFAVKDLPPGTSLSWTPALLVSADARTYSGADLREFTRALDDAAVRLAAAPAARGDVTARAE